MGGGKGGGENRDTRDHRDNRDTRDIRDSRDERKRRDEGSTKDGWDEGSTGRGKEEALGKTDGVGFEPQRRDGGGGGLGLRRGAEGGRIRA
jgi:hypothetical protein